MPADMRNSPLPILSCQVPLMNTVKPGDWGLHALLNILLTAHLPLTIGSNTCKEKYILCRIYSSYIFEDIAVYG
jgi:hypothetical protein